MTKTWVRERITTSGVRNTPKSPVSFPPLRAGKGVTDLKPASVQSGFLLLEGSAMCCNVSHFVMELKKKKKKIHHIPDGPLQPCQADWDMTGLLEGKNEKKRKHKLWLDTETAIVSCTHQQLCISAGGDYREGSVFGSGPDSEDPLPPPPPKQRRTWGWKWREAKGVSLHTSAQS